MRKPSEINVLIACEESQITCTAFRERGFNCYSADIQECSGGHPEWHILGDVLPILNGNCEFTLQNGQTDRQTDRWDLIIAHPPCTYMSNAGARHLYPGGTINEERLRKGIEATHFFMAFYYADCKHIAIENPVPSSVYMLPKCTQIIQPWMFGHPYSKMTCLWLRGLPNLVPTDIVEKRESSRKSKWYNSGGKERQKNRSKTFQGIANAFAEQWGKYLTEN